MEIRQRTKTLYSEHKPSKYWFLIGKSINRSDFSFKCITGNMKYSASFLRASSCYTSNTILVCTHEDLSI